MKSLAIVLATGMALSHVATTHAALITWTTGPTTITSVNDISLNGTLVHAGRWGGVAVNVTRGMEVINFADRPVGGDDGIAGTNAPQETTLDAFAAPGGFDANFHTVLDGFSFNNSNQQVTLLGLLVGRQYEAQFFVSDDRGCCNGRNQEWSDNSVDNVGNDTTAFTHGSSSFVIGQFTADSTTQNFFARGISNDAVVNAYVLRDVTAAAAVPEPASVAVWSLLGLGLAGYGVARHRRGTR